MTFGQEVEAITELAGRIKSTLEQSEEEQYLDSGIAVELLTLSEALLTYMVTPNEQIKAEAEEAIRELFEDID